MSYHDILYDVSDGIGRVTLNRPEKRNALGAGTVGELCAALRAARDDEAVRAIVLTGAGKIFCAGGDLSQMGGQGVSGGQPAGSFVDLNLAFTEAGKPTIAMVNGHALAGGLGLVTACDLAIASTEAQFGTPEINVGLWPMMIMATIFRNVPRKAGLEMILTGDRVAADRAVAMGLVNRAVPPEKLEDETMALARKLAGKSPAVMRLGLRAFHETQDMELRAALAHLEKQLFAVLMTEDAREGLMAFLQKREPTWRGR